MIATREAQTWNENYDPALQARSYRREAPIPTRGGAGWGLAGLAALALIVVGGIYIWPDVQRYMRIRNM